MVKGYYECAYSRFVDVVCQTISCELFDICRNQLAEELKQNLGIRKEDGELSEFCFKLQENTKINF